MQATKNQATQTSTQQSAQTTKTRPANAMKSQSTQTPKKELRFAEPLTTRAAEDNSAWVESEERALRAMMNSLRPSRNAPARSERNDPYQPAVIRRFYPRPAPARHADVGGYDG